MRKLIATMGLTALVVAGAMTWNMPQSSAQSSATLPSFSVSNMTETLNGIGAANVKSGSTEKGARYITFSEGGRNYLMVLYACEKSGTACKGLHVAATFDAAGYSQQVINKFNGTYPFGKAHITSDGILVSSRYFISDHGIPQKNVVSELQNFFGMTTTLIEYIKNAGIVASLPSPTRTLSYGAPVTTPDGQAHEGTDAFIVRLAPMNRLN